jgi:N-methylhydantoinase A
MGTDDLVGLADGALRIAVAKMAGAVRKVSVHRGFDPRAFVLIGFGGAGPMHVFLVADELAIEQVVVPRLPGHLSALGQMLADIRRDYVAAWGGALRDLDIAALRERAGVMIDRAAGLLAADGSASDRHRHVVSLDLRYVGQSFTLPIGWNPDDADWAPLRRAFDERHTETFGYADAENDVEIVNVRLVSSGLVDKPELTFGAASAGDPVMETRPVWFDGWRDCPVYDRDRLAAGFSFEGPAVVEEAGGTSIVPPGWSVTVHDSGALVCVREG